MSKLPLYLSVISFVLKGGATLGIIEDNKTYTLSAIAEALGYKQTRSVERLLSRIGCPVVSLGGKKLISGTQFRLAVERAECSQTSLHGS